mmetsp:Transcript_39546/g.70914  ORF Transcript_39546/g.70914 Transcript_39546/m.70914 type:complete len:116 (+) Transcript_39546:126-473(+)
MAEPKAIKPNQAFDAYIGSSTLGDGKWNMGCFFYEEPGGLRIGAVMPTGAVAEWNASHEDRAVLPGDLITEIEKDPAPNKDGITGDGKLLKSELYSRRRGQPMRFTMEAGPNHTG